MKISPGTFIISAAALQDENFIETIIVITENNASGATGFVINKPFPRKLNELVEFTNAKPFSLFAGGPCDTEHIFVLHQRPQAISGSTWLFGNTYLGGIFNETLQCIQADAHAANEIKLFIGYCGWDAGELEAEIAEGSWHVTELPSPVIFSANPPGWQQLIDQVNASS